MTKTVIVTGSSRGLGEEIVKVLLSEGYNVIGISRSQQDDPEILRNKNYQFIHFDLSHPERIKDLYLEKIKEMGPIHGLVNNAGVAYDDIATNLNLESLEAMFKVNIYSPMMLTKYIIRDMLLHKTKGSIVNISSISGHTGYKGLSMYASSKLALEAFSKNIAREWGRVGIRSNSVCPGFLETEMSSSLDSVLKNKIYSRTALGIATKTKSVAETVSFLLSSKAESITGQVLHVDSGTI